MKTLHLTLKKKWFDMIASGEKTEEYREIKPYWASRLLNRIQTPNGRSFSPWADIVHGDYDFKGWSNFTHNAPVFKEFTSVFFTHGYGSHRPSMLFKVRLICIQDGNPEWGATNGPYFVIKIGDRIEVVIEQSKNSKS